MSVLVQTGSETCWRIRPSLLRQHTIMRELLGCLMMPTSGPWLQPCSWQIGVHPIRQSGPNTSIAPCRSGLGLAPFQLALMGRPMRQGTRIALCGASSHYPEKTVDQPPMAGRHLSVFAGTERGVAVLTVHIDMLSRAT